LLAFIVAKVANLPFDTEGADLIALSTTGIVDRAGLTEVRLTIADTAALHHRSYDSVDSTGRRD
jgi:hypothetical protein